MAMGRERNRGRERGGKGEGRAAGETGGEIKLFSLLYLPWTQKQKDLKSVV